MQDEHWWDEAYDREHPPTSDELDQLDDALDDEDDLEDDSWDYCAHEYHPLRTTRETLYYAYRRVYFWVFDHLPLRAQGAWVRFQIRRMPHEEEPF